MEIKRDIHLGRLIHSKHNRKIKVVTGVRRCGKSYLLSTLFRNHLLSEGIQPDHIIWIDLEDRRNKALRDPDALLQYIDSKLLDADIHYIMIDEIQHVDEFEDVLNSYLKTPNADVYVTGSNSKFLSSDVITEFRGRGHEIRITPLSFSEFYTTCPNQPRDKAFEEYCVYGGLPLVVLEPDAREKRNYLKTLFSKTYLTDIKERHRIRKDDDLEDLVNILASSIGGLVNPQKIVRTFETVKKSKISHTTVKSYLDYLIESFLLSKAMRYDVKGRAYINTQSKYYFSDLGLRNARLDFRQIELTHLMENAIYNELLLRGMEVSVGMVEDFFTDKEGKRQHRRLEVDFVVNDGSKRCYIQSAYRLDDEGKMEQELRSLRGIDDSFARFVITERPTYRYQNDEGTVFMDIYDFLLDPNSLNN